MLKALSVNDPGKIEVMKKFKSQNKENARHLGEFINDNAKKNI